MTLTGRGRSTPVSRALTVLFPAPSTPTRATVRWVRRGRPGGLGPTVTPSLSRWRAIVRTTAGARGGSGRLPPPRRLPRPHAGRHGRAAGGHTGAGAGPWRTD